MSISPQVMEDNDLIVEIEGVEEMQQQNQSEHRRLTHRMNKLERQLDESILKKSLEVSKEELDFLREEKSPSNSRQGHYSTARHVQGIVRRDGNGCAVEIAAVNGRSCKEDSSTESTS